MHLFMHSSARIGEGLAIAGAFVAVIAIWVSSLWLAGALLGVLTLPGIGG